MRRILLFTTMLLCSTVIFAQDYWSSHTDATRIITDKAVARRSFPTEFKLFDLNKTPLQNELFKVVSNAARKSEAAPSTEPRKKFLNQPLCGEQPSAANGRPSSNAPQPHPTIKEENKIAPWPVTTDQRLSPTSAIESRSANASATTRINWVTCKQIRNARQKIASRQPLRK